MKNNIFRILLLGFAVLAGITPICAREPGEATRECAMTFDTYMSRVGKHNLEYMAERLNVNIAEAEVIAAKVLPDPSIDFEAAKDTYTLGISYSLEFGKRSARVQLAKSEMQLEKAALELSFQELRAEAADFYLEAILRRELLKAKKEACNYMFQLSRSDSLRYLAGEITEIEYRQSGLEASSLLGEVYDQEAAYQSSLVDLNMFMGVNADTLNIPAGNWDSLSRDFTLEELLETGIKENLNIVAASLDMDVNSKALKLVQRERLPDIELSLSYERDWNSFRPQMQYAKVAVSVPLPFSSINKGSVKSAKYKIEQAAVRKQETTLQVQANITQAWYAFEAEKKKVALFRTGVLDDARKVLDGTVYMYHRGESGILDVLIAQRSYNQVQQDYLETMKSYVSSLVALEKSCGIWDIHF